MRQSSESLSKAQIKIARFWNKLPETYISQHVVLASDYNVLAAKLAKMKNELKKARKQLTEYQSIELPKEYNNAVEFIRQTKLKAQIEAYENVVDIIEHRKNCHEKRLRVFPKSETIKCEIRDCIKLKRVIISPMAK